MTIPQTLIPGVYTEVDDSQTNKSLPSGVNKVLLIGQRLQVSIDPAAWQGGTLNDMTNSGTPTGTVKLSWIVIVDGTGTPDTFKWSNDGGTTFTSTVSMTGAAQNLAFGVSVTFAATTGHAVDDEWRFVTWPEPETATAVDYEIEDINHAAEQSGFGSMVHIMARNLLKTKAVRVFGIGLNDAGGATDSAGSITLSGTATVSGSWTVYAGSIRAEVGISTGDTAAAIVIAMQNRLLEFDYLPVTVAITTAGKLQFTARNGGTIGDDIDLDSVFVGSAGLSAVIVEMTGGATDPDIDDALTPVFTKDYNRYVSFTAVQSELVKVRTHLTSKSSATEKRRAICVYGQVGSLAASETLSLAINDERMTAAHYRLSSSTRGNIPYEFAACYEAIVAAETNATQPLNKRQLIGDLIPSSSSSDAWTRANMESLLDEGVSPIVFTVDQKFQIVRDVTTYTNKSGTPDTTWREGTTIRGVDFTHESIETRLELAFADAKNTQRVRDDIKSNVIDVEERLEVEGVEILKNVADHEEATTVTTDGSDVNRVNVVTPIEVVGGLHVIAITTQLLLS